MKNKRFLYLLFSLIVLSSCNKNPYIGDNGNWYVNGEDAGIQAEGKDGDTPNITIGTNGNWFINGIDSGISATGDKGDKGDTGNGILDISLTSSKGLVDTYTITYTNGSTDTFNVFNGNDGSDGLTPTFKVENDCLLVSYDNGESYKNLGNIKGLTGDKGDTGDKGEDGITPNLKINETNNEWEVSYDNGQTWTSLGVKATGNQGEMPTITIGTNGNWHINGVDTSVSAFGKDGKNPTISIGENSNWFIDGIDSNISALGAKGDTGVGIKDIIVNNEKDQNNNEYIVFTFSFTDETIDPLTQKVLLPTMIIDGGRLVTNSFIKTNNEQEKYDLEIFVKYSNGTIGTIPLDTDNIIYNNVNFNSPGCYSITYTFLSEEYTSDIYVLDDILYDYRQSLIDEVNNTLQQYYYLDDLTKNDYLNIINELNAAYNELTLQKIKTKYLSLKDTLVDTSAILTPFDVKTTTELYYFDASDPADIQEKSIIEYKGQYSPSTGCYYTYNNNKFDVLSSCYGEVIEIRMDPLFGRTIVIKNGDYIFTYSSVSDVKVQVGDKVSAGQIIAKASVCTLLSQYGNGLYVYISQGAKTLNPRNVYNYDLTSPLCETNIGQQLFLQGYVIEGYVNNDAGFYLYTNNGSIFVYDNGKSKVKHGDKISLSGYFNSYNIDGNKYYEIDITQQGSYINMINNNTSVLPITEVKEIDLHATSSFQDTEKTFEEVLTIFHTSAYLIGSEEGKYKLSENIEGNGNTIYWFQNNINYYANEFGIFDANNPLNHIEGNIVNDGCLHDFYFVILSENLDTNFYEIVPLFYN